MDATEGADLETPGEPRPLIEEEPLNAPDEPAEHDGAGAGEEAHGQGQRNRSHGFGPLDAATDTLDDGRGHLGCGEVLGLAHPAGCRIMVLHFSGGVRLGSLRWISW